ncbi:hypothetical protein EC957_006947 [Mortierella hygrophila]|uniref:Uncharacterized protein n=1 Tax=Mortierella hygrophila TaxID=979708 RepID=A0A9P6EXK1_9FUNG|nr:hypothetical protein EC957_006947 [Mortierella hygrophila]
MASSALSSALPPAEVDTSTSLPRSVSPAASQTSVFQSLATQLELYMKRTDSALVNSQTALVNSQTALEQSQIVLQQSDVALQQITTSIAALEEKVDAILKTTTAYQADINAKWENLTERLALQVGENPPSKKVRLATSSRTSGNSSSYFSGSLLSTSINTINLPDDNEQIQRNQVAMAARQNEEFYRAAGIGVATDDGQEEGDNVEKDAGNNEHDKPK